MKRKFSGLGLALSVLSPHLGWGRGGLGGVGRGGWLEEEKRKFWGKIGARDNFVFGTR